MDKRYGYLAMISYYYSECRMNYILHAFFIIVMSETVGDNEKR